jgi:hypothetical protein
MKNIYHDVIERLNTRKIKSIEVSFIVGICLLGIILRIYFYVINRSLWLDEAMLALNIINRSFLELFKPLDYNQGAPIGFLILQKLFASIFGTRDYIFRLIPLVSGILSIYLIYKVSKKIGRQISPYICLVLFVLSPRLIYYSSELKQYSTDVLATLLLLFFVLNCLDKNCKPQSLITLGIIGLITLWFSHPSIFVYTGILIALGLTFAIRKDMYLLYWLVGIGIASGINFALIYFINLRFLASNNILIAYWSGSYAPLPPWSNLNWYLKAAIGILRDPTTLPISLITIVILILGTISIGLRRWQILLVILCPFLLTLLASALQKYPFSGRLLLFLIPLLLLLVADGVEQTRFLLLKVNRPLAELLTASLVIFFLYQPIITSYKNLLSPPLGENIKPIMSQIQNNYQKTDLIYVYYGAQPAFEFYARQFGLSNKDYLVGVWSRNEPSLYLKDIQNFIGNSRVWFVFSHNCSWCKVNEEEYILHYLNEVGSERDVFFAEGASLYLYDLRQSP